MHSTLKHQVYRLHAEVCQALSDPTRILILYALQEGPRNVSELMAQLEASQPAISRHLKVLRDRRMVTAERSGLNVYYRLADKRIVRALDLLRDVMKTQTIEAHQTLLEHAG